MSDLVLKNNSRGGHVSAWLGAYLDGEVSQTLRGQIEAHLQNCPGCQHELEELRRLSALLQACPVPPSPQSDTDFAQAVIERAARHVPPPWQRGLTRAWRWAPLFLFVFWVFFQAVQWVSAAVLFGLHLAPGGQALLPFAESAQDGFLLELLRMGLPGRLTGPVIEGLAWLAPFDPFALLNLAVLVVLALLFLSWLASWWAYHRARAAGRS